MFKRAWILGMCGLLAACGGGGGGSPDPSPQTFVTYTKQVQTWDLPSANRYPKLMTAFNNKLYLAITGPDASVYGAEDQIASFDPQTDAFSTEWSIGRPYAVAFDGSASMWASAHPGGGLDPGIYPKSVAATPLSTQSAAVYAGLVYDASQTGFAWGRSYNSASKVFFGSDATAVTMTGTPGALLLQGGQLWVVRSDAGPGSAQCGIQRLVNGAWVDFACAASFNRPQGLAYSAATANYYVVNSGIPTDAATWSVYRVGANGVVESTAFLTQADGLCNPVGAAVLGNYLYVSNGPCASGGKGRILRVNLS